MVINNTAGLAKAAKAFGVPTILTTVIADRGGLLFPQITEVFPGQEVIDRTLINTRSEEHTSELQSLMRISYAVFCLKKKNITKLLVHNLTIVISFLYYTSYHIL